MKKSLPAILVVLIASMLMLTSCSASKKHSCGCPGQSGMAGYNFK